MNKKRFVRSFAISITLLSTLVGFVIWSGLFYAPNAHALAKGDASPTDIMKKALVHNMRVCYDAHYMRTPLRSDKAKLGDGGYDTRYGHDNYMFYGYSTENLLPIPTLVGNTIKDSDVSCAQSIAGYNKGGQKMVGLLSLFSKPDFDGDGTGTNMVAMGYTPAPKEDDQSQVGKHIFKISYTYQDTANAKLEDAKSGSITATYGANGDLISSPDTCYESNGTPKSSSKMFCIDNLNSSLQVLNGKLWGTVDALSYRNGTPYSSLAAYQISMDEGEIDFSGIPSWHQQQTDCAGQPVTDVTDLGNGFTVGNKFYACAENLSREFSNLKVEYTFEPDESQTITHEKYEITDFSAARQHFVDYLGASSYDSAWTANEKFTVYYSYYIARVKNDNKNNGYLSIEESSCIDSLNAGILATGNSYYLPHNGKWCKVNIDDKLIVNHKTVANDEGKFAILTGTQTKMTSGKDADAFREVVRELMQIHDQINIGEVGEIGDVPDPDPTPVDPNPDPEPEDETKPTCYNSSDSLSWILCPVLNILATVTQGVYEDYIAPSMEIQRDLVGSDTHDAWEKFRDYANIAFVIVFLVVIFSQVTGLGLDNYNVKKILPKLVVVAVLVNLSFIICQIAVDMSNIVGSSIYTLFRDDLSVTVPSNLPTTIASFAKGIASWVATGAVAWGGISLLVNNTAVWVVPLILFMISAVIGVLFFAILLGIRKAGIILLVVLSPVAIVCYALPNLKRFYERWFKMFSALLLLYPICGALMGGGEFASKLLLKVGNTASAGFFFQLVAMLVQIVPVFFIPVLVRSSFTTLGNLGNRLLGLRDRWSRGATGLIRNTEAMKDWQQRMGGNNALRKLNRFQANRDFRGRLGTWMNNRGLNGDSLLNSDARNRAQTRAINAAGAQMLANQIATQTAMDGMKGIESRQSAQLIKHFMDTYDNDIAFKADFDSQEAEYEAALDALELDPNSQEAQAKVRALQKFMGSSSDGQEKIKKVLNRKLTTEQENARREGRDAKLSNSMHFAAQTLLAENGGGFKATDRGFSGMVKTMAGNNGSNVFNGKFRAVEHYDQQGNLVDTTYHNDTYAAQAWKADASSLAGANDTALDDVIVAINNGELDANQLDNIYANATEALTSDNLHVKSENYGRLENIRRAAHNAMASNTSLYDDAGNLYNKRADGRYVTVDHSDNEHVFTRAADGSLIEQGGSGQTIAANRVIGATERFQGRYGNTYNAVRDTDSSSVHIDHTNGSNIILPGQPGYNSQTVLGNQGGQGPHIAN